VRLNRAAEFGGEIVAIQTTFDDMRPTPAGVDPYEAKSALQKSIRRDLEEDALYWAAQLAVWNATSLWNRLKVIASEDVGLASPSAAIMVRALFENWDEATRHGEEQKNGYLYITHAVLVLARSKKSRIVDHATMLAFDGLLAARDVPDYALDKHTTRGRAKGRGLKHFFEVGTKLENCGLEDPYEARAKAAKVAAPGKVSD
jgi:replication-associated recombination protein RarA